MANFQEYQMEKSQAVDLLDRVACRMMDEQGRDFDYDNQDGLNEVMRLCREIDSKRTQLSLMQLDGETLASMLAHVDATKCSAVEYFARYFSNLNTSVEEFRLAAGAPLKSCDQLLRQCVHGVDIATECCLPCDVGKTMMGLLNTVSRLEIVRR